MPTALTRESAPAQPASVKRTVARWTLGRLLLWIGGGTAVSIAVAIVALLMLVLAMAGSSVQPRTAAGVYGVSPFALRDIPRDRLELYQQTGRKSGIDWAVIAGIGKVECDHGRLPHPACSERGAENFAGAGGPMQFLAATWTTYGADGDGDGRKDRWEPADAIAGTANYLRASGAPDDYRRAIWAYNHATWYVDDVLDYASRYRGALTSGPGGDAAGGRTPDVAGPKATVDSTGMAHAPAEAPAEVKRIIAAGNRIGNRPYVYGGGHPAFLTDHGLDCSSSTSYLLHAAGVYPSTSSIVSGSFARWGEPGPGRWVTIYANAEHVFTVTAGLRNDTGRYDTGANAGESGPRWRAGDRPTAGFTVRHPPGL